ncbi:disease resistance protein RGA2-like isoform X2 [Carex rostrata]
MAEVVAARCALTMAKWVASPIISKLLKEGYSYLEMDVAARIDKLEATILPQLQEVIDAAEKHGHKSNMEKWLRRLKDAMYEAEDALDFYKSRLLQQKNHGTTVKKISNKLISKLNILSTEEKNLKQCLNKLEKIALEAKDFRDLLERQVKINPSNSIKEPMVTTSIPPLRIFGRDADCDYLLKELLEPVTEPESSQVRSYSVYSIVGVGGAGKTTLAQLFYNHERVTAEFDLRIWLSMTRGLDLFRHTRILIEGASKKECPCLDNFDTLQGFLIDSIKSKKILVMMDDVWWDETMNEQKWEQFVAPLANAKRGSQILVTSRTENMPCTLLPRKIMPLKNLEENQFFSLFMHHAFGDLEPNSTHSLESLERIGKQIAKKLSRSPLAAKAVGSRLFKNLNEWFWRDTLERDMLTDTMQSLLWSYQNLDAPIQRCFSYCAIFPKGYRFDKRDLILLWVAEGFIHSSTRRIEDVGDDYFKELLSVFFFQEGEYGIIGMHDLFHDLAERVSRDDCFKIEDGKVREIPVFARHLSIQGENFNEYITSVEKLKNLRSVIFIYPVTDDVINSFLKKIEKFSKLRVLDFCKCSIEKLPNSVGELVLLRYLGLSGTDVAELPTSVEKLYNLQTLRLSWEITHLPRGLNKLVNLRHFECFSSLPEIGNLTSLQNLDDFRVKSEIGFEISQLKHLNEIRGSLEILDLKNIKNRGEATEAHLKDKKHLQHLSLDWGDDDAMDGNLNAHLDVLEGLEPHSNLEKLEIEGYKSPMLPSWKFQQGSHDNLISLKLRKCPSLEVLPPIVTLFPCLGKITIEKLPKITKLPLFPSSLKELCIRECGSLVFIYEEELQKGDYEVRLLKAMQDCQFKFILETIPDIKYPAWRKLLEECSELRRLMEWKSHGKVKNMRVLAMNIKRAEITTDGIWEAHLQLIKLRMEYIYSKKEKYPLIVPPGLEKLMISSCYITDEALMHCLAQLTCLKSLRLDGIRTITTLPPKEILCQLAVLDCLIINSCDFLISLGGLHALVSIKELHICNCPWLEIPGEGGRGTLPSSLENVEIFNSYSIRDFQVIDLQSLSRATFSGCVQLKSMELRNLSSLKFLGISNCCKLETIYSDMPDTLQSLTLSCCPAIASLPVLPKSLQDLEISNCPILSKRCQEPNGEDWPKISHVRKRHIYETPIYL